MLVWWGNKDELNSVTSLRYSVLYLYVLFIQTHCIYQVCGYTSIWPADFVIED